MEILLLVLISVIAASEPPAPRCRPEEHDALRDFRTSLNGGSGVFDSWDDATSCCEWSAIKCNSSTKGDDDSRRFTAANIPFRVTSIVISGASLTGRLPSSIAALQALEVLDLSGNQLTGGIPREISGLTSLRILDLSNNNLSASIVSKNVTLPTSIEVLNFSVNNFDGPLPSFTGMPRLQKLDLSDNFFQGAIPSDFACVFFVNISTNSLTGPPLGTYPERCGDTIEYYVADSNLLDGPIPSSIAKLPALRVLSLSSNTVHGIPVEIGSLSKLEELLVENSFIVGTIPSTITNCSSLKLLSLRQNHLHGSIDHFNFDNMSHLTILDLSYNRLNGTIPASISKCSSLTMVALGRNFFTGEIPASLGTLQQLETLVLSGNNLTGGVPASLQGCSSLVSLILSKNYFTQPLPGNITGFKSLQLLAIGNANLPGSVPEWLANCRNLQVLDMSWNRLEGGVPRWLGTMQHLFYVDLSNNTLTGELPTELSDIRCLQVVDLSGLKPPAAYTLFVKHTSNSSALEYRRLSAFPPSLILASNRLTGSIPSELGRLKKMVALDLSHNQLTGTIPDTLGNARSLEYLDLSCNQLTGTIPWTLESLNFLATFNVSVNQLEGPVPDVNQFPSFTPASYLGNHGLCGVTIRVQCPLQPASALRAPAPGTTTKGLGRAALMGVTISVSLGLTALFAAMLMLSFARRRCYHDGNGHLEENFKELSLAQMMNLTVTMFHRDRGYHGERYNQSYHQLKDYHDQRITVGDLIKATNNFDASNIIGCGGFGLVFKARLPSGKLVAIKRLTGDDGGPQMEKEFDAELMTLGMVSHENLVPLEGYCRLGSLDRLLVYSYMENGSLDYWLHERADGGLLLGWERRLEILRGAAKGLEYLHRGCDPHIVHRDIKSSNILLDSGFRAHVADFGLARLMLPSDTHVTTELVGTLGYIPPEYAQSAVASLRGDVYSFGVLILEVLSRRRPVDVGAAARRRGARDLVPWVRAMCEAGRGKEILDALLLVEDAGSTMVMLRVLEVACRCVESCPQRRPSIEEVVAWLHYS